MENNITKEMEKLKKELHKKKEEVHDLKELVKNEIDKDYPSNLEDFSERELESQLDEYLSLLNKYVDPVPDKTSITSHRRLIGTPVVWIKRIFLKITKSYITHILGKQKIFNQKCVALYQNLIIHQKKYHDKISQIEERIGECEVHLEVIAKKLEEISANLDQNRADTSPGKPDKENT
ncbi:MAG: hypothetical protein JSV17_10100 [Candidatus Aminicenantes bacterium]|nr:MAG: hypothetical protein JSV17_10100 [Candidatus Aminicenantes bacterium]